MAHETLKRAALITGGVAGVAGLGLGIHNANVAGNPNTGGPESFKLTQLAYNQTNDANINTLNTNAIKLQSTVTVLEGTVDGQGKRIDNVVATNTSQDGAIKSNTEAIKTAQTQIATLAATPVPTLRPTEVKNTPTVDAVPFDPFANAADVVKVRGGNPNNWVMKVEVRDGTNGLTTPEPSNVRFGHKIDGTMSPINLTKSEWMYRGSMSDLKPEYQIPQSVEAIAKQLGGNVKAENIRVIRITHDSKSAGYAKWMDLWQVPEGTIVGYELMQNHQTINGGTSAGGLKPYEFNVPAGAVVEAYDDRQSEEPGDDVAATILNKTNKPTKLFVSGATVWPWGDPNALIIEQGNFENGAPGATSSAIVNGKIIKLNAASNVLSSQTTHAIVTIDEKTGRIVLTGMINSPGAQPVKDEANR